MVKNENFVMLVMDFFTAQKGMKASTLADAEWCA